VPGFSRVREGRWLRGQRAPEPGPGSSSNYDGGWTIRRLVDRPAT
jgi:hypothetical protein